jgi:hypothetical protein
MSGNKLSFFGKTASCQASSCQASSCRAASCRAASYRCTNLFIQIFIYLCILIAAFHRSGAGFFAVTTVIFVQVQNAERQNVEIQIVDFGAFPNRT